ncbi:DUF7146 domain-containing protein [Glacieibacterium sp.]|uniref:DUF7146 domain-containing protein n=1 Tax=Glacieibacterium sp. TaxID=2860237 RepID=UPI003AFFC405
MIAGRTHPTFDRIDVEAIKAQVSLRDVVARRVQLKPRGREFLGLCPFHDERTASFGISEDKGMFHCFGCGANGDVIRFVMLSEGLEFLEAARWLQGGDFPAVDPLVRQAALIRDDAERLAKIADAQALWSSAIPAAGTPATVYARSRGITAPLPGSIRYARTWAWKDYDTGKVGPELPALVGAVQDVSGKVMGVQRIFLKPDGSGKADMRAPKRSLGQLAGCAMRLGRAAPHIVVVEGPEDGLTLAQGLPDVSIWVACGTAMMSLLQLPEVVTTVTLAGDNNAPGRFAVETAGAAFVAQGREVRTMFPDPAFADFNDELRGIRSER